MAGASGIQALPSLWPAPQQQEKQKLSPRCVFGLCCSFCLSSLTALRKRWDADKLLRGKAYSKAHNGENKRQNLPNDT